MPRLRRDAWKTFSITCAAFAGLLLVMMLVSFWHWDRWSIFHGRSALIHGTELSLESMGGGIGISFSRHYELRDGWDQNAPENFGRDSTGRLMQPGPWRVTHWSERGRMGLQLAGYLGWGAFNGINGGFIGATDWTVSYRIRFPHWLAIILLSLPVSIRTLRRLRHRTIDRGRCTHCGCDLRETPLRCPECGKVADSFSRGKMV